MNSFIPVEPVKDEKQQEKPVAVVQSEQQKENPVEPVPIINQQNNLGAVGVQGGQQLTKFFNNAMTNNV